MRSLVYAFRWVCLIPSNVAIIILAIYRKIVSPLYGQVCKYYPSCSKYAVNAYQHKNFFVATGMVLWRLLRCNPWSAGGINEVSCCNNRKITAHGFVIPAEERIGNNV